MAIAIRSFIGAWTCARRAFRLLVVDLGHHACLEAGTGRGNAFNRIGD